jgi:putative Holliday junction resolvase
MRLLGLDWGEIRIGVSVSDPLGMTALPLSYIKNDKNCIAELKDLIEKYDIGEIVVGLPKTLKGDLGVAASKVIGFCDVLKKQLDIKVSLWDERLTTKMARASLVGAGVSREKMKQSIDSYSASVMLQSSMDSRKHAQNNKTNN